MWSAPPTRGEQCSAIAIDIDPGQPGITRPRSARAVGPQPLSLRFVRFFLALEPSPAGRDNTKGTVLFLQVMNDFVDQDAAVPHVVFGIEPVVKIDCRATGIPPTYLARALACDLLKLDVRDKFDDRILGGVRISGKDLYHGQQFGNQSGDAC